MIDRISFAAHRVQGLSQRLVARGKTRVAASVVLMTLVVMAAAAGIYLNSASGNRDPAASNAARPPTETAVELNETQLQAITIGQAASYPFAVKIEALGSISFAVDPALVQAESSLVSAAANFRLTDRELTRARSLYGANGGVAERELEQATADQQTAAANLTVARDTLRSLGESTAEIDALIASGKIAPQSSGVGPVIWLLAYVSELDSPQVKTGQTVEMTLPAYPDRSFRGKVVHAYSAVDPATHRVAVRCEIAGSVDGLRPGMLASAEIEIQPPQDSVAIPANSVVREGDGTMTAWVTADRRHFSQRVVTTGLREDGRVQILSGLKAGEWVVTDGAIFLDNMLQAPSDD